MGYNQRAFSGGLLSGQQFMENREISRRNREEHKWAAEDRATKQKEEAMKQAAEKVAYILRTEGPDEQKWSEQSQLLVANLHLGMTGGDGKTVVKKVHYDSLGNSIYELAGTRPDGSAFEGQPMTEGGSSKPGAKVLTLPPNGTAMSVAVQLAPFSPNLQKLSEQYEFQRHWDAYADQMKSGGTPATESPSLKSVVEESTPPATPPATTPPGNQGQTTEAVAAPEAPFASRAQALSGEAIAADGAPLVEDVSADLVKAQNVKFTPDHLAILDEVSGGDAQKRAFLETAARIENRGFGQPRTDAVSQAGAVGPFQFMPETARAYGVQNPADFRQAAAGAAAYYDDLYKRYNGNMSAMLAEYNGGTRNGRAVAAGGQPSNPETRKYVSMGDQLLRALNPIPTAGADEVPRTGAAPPPPAQAGGVAMSPGAPTLQEIGQRGAQEQGFVSKAAEAVLPRAGALLNSPPMVLGAIGQNLGSMLPQGVKDGIGKVADALTERPVERLVRQGLDMRDDPGRIAKLVAADPAGNVDLWREKRGVMPATSTIENDVIDGLDRATILHAAEKRDAAIKAGDSKAAAMYAKQVDQQGFLIAKRASVTSQAGFTRPVPAGQKTADTIGPLLEDAAADLAKLGVSPAPGQVTSSIASINNYVPGERFSPRFIDSLGYLVYAGKLPIDDATRILKTGAIDKKEIKNINPMEPVIEWQPETGNWRVVYPGATVAERIAILKAGKDGSKSPNDNLFGQLDKVLGSADDKNTPYAGLLTKFGKPALMDMVWKDLHGSLGLFLAQQGLIPATDGRPDFEGMNSMDVNRILVKYLDHLSKVENWEDRAWYQRLIDGWNGEKGPDSSPISVYERQPGESKPDAAADPDRAEILRRVRERHPHLVNAPDEAILEVVRKGPGR